VWYSAFSSLRKLIRALYESGFEVCIFSLSADDLHKKLSTPINSIKVVHSSGKSATPFRKIGGGGLFWTLTLVSMSICSARRVEEFSA